MATLETINLVRTITLKRRFLIGPALEFIFQGLESFVEYYSFFFSPLLLIFTRLVTWETLVLNWFCGIVGKGKLLIPF